MSFAEQYGPWAVIAGGSEGIGAAIAHRVAAEGVNVVLLARKPGPLEEVADEIRTKYGVEVRQASVDLTAPDLADQVEKIVEGLEVGMLVYNAGARGTYEYLIDEPLEDSLRILRLNCVGPLTLCHMFGTQMAARGRGGILLISGMVCFGGTAGVAIYAASKAFETTLAEGLWYEMRERGVDVLVVPAGATHTPAMERIPINFEDFHPMAADDVAREALEHLNDGPMLVPGEQNRARVEALSKMTRRERVEASSKGAALVWGRL